MASSSEDSAVKANLLGKRNLEDDLETKPILKKHKENSEEEKVTETTKGFDDTLQQIETKSDQANLISVKEANIRRRKTLFVGDLSCDTQVSDIIDFFKDVGEVVHVRLVVNHSRKHMGYYAYVVFASSKDAKKALQNKNGESLYDRKIFLTFSMRDPCFPRTSKYCKDDKVWYKDGFLQESLLIEEDETAEGLDETPDFVEEPPIRTKTLYVGNLSPHIKISDIIDFFKDVGEVVRVQLNVNHLWKPKCGFVEFASVNEAKKALQKKGEVLEDSKIFLAVANKKYHRSKFCIDHKVWSGHYLGQHSLSIEENEMPSDFVEDVLFVANLSPQAKIINVINFFNNVGVVSVRLIVNHEGKHVGYGFVEFASSNEAKKALEENNGEYMLDHKIFLHVVKSAPYPPRPKNNLAEMLCYDDYLRRESLRIEDDETPNCVEAVAIRKKTLFVNHLSCHTEISDIIKFFKDVGEVVHVRLFVNHKGKHVGRGFVEFASANEAKKALEKKNGEYLQDRVILLDVARTDQYLPRPMYCIDHKVWYEDYLQRERLLIEEDKAVEGLDETPNYVKEVAINKKTLFVAILPRTTRIKKIVDFFKDVGTLCRVRLIVNDRSEHVGCAFVEFASAKEAKKVLRIKNGEILCGRNIFLYEVEMAPYPIRPKYNLAEMLWYKDYLERESLLSLLIGEGVGIGEGEDLETKQNLKNHKFNLIGCGTKIMFSDSDDD